MRSGAGRVFFTFKLMKTKNLLAVFVFIAGPIALFASSDTDRKIEDAAKASYNYRTVLEGHVKVSATDGIVTLTGTVQDKDDKDLAADTVENLPGVLNVDNQIKVEPTYPEHSDAWMAFKIRSTLLVKANVSAIDTKVVVKDGIVTLSGTTQNAAQKDLTEAYAKDIDGVKSVTNDLVVTPPPADQQTISEKIDDASITSQVKYALLCHGSTSALKTHITTTEGVVAITGEADSDAEKSLVTKLAMDVRGTKSVTNDMTVKS
jgi:osmotically-inducible protein OsmY